MYMGVFLLYVLLDRLDVALDELADRRDERSGAIAPYTTV